MEFQPGFGNHQGIAIEEFGFEMTGEMKSFGEQEPKKRC